MLFLVILWAAAFIFKVSVISPKERRIILKFVSLMLWAHTLNKHLIKGESCGFDLASFVISVKAFSLSCHFFEKNCFVVSYSKNYCIMRASAALFPSIYYAAGSSIGWLSGGRFYDSSVFILCCRVGMTLSSYESAIFFLLIKLDFLTLEFLLETLDWLWRSRSWFISSPTN